MPSQTHSTLDSGHSTPPSDDEVLVRVEGVSKKFCRSLKKSLWYGVCDIASELNPFGRTTGQSIAYNNLTTIERHGGREKEQLKVGPKGEGVGRTESKDTEETVSGSGEQKVGTSGPVVHEFEKSGVYGETPLLMITIYETASSSPSRMFLLNSAGGNAWG